MSPTKKVNLKSIKYFSFRAEQRELELVRPPSSADIPKEASARGAAVKGQCRAEIHEECPTAVLQTSGTTALFKTIWADFNLSDTFSKAQIYRILAQNTT